MIREPGRLSDVSIYPHETAKAVPFYFRVNRIVRDVSGVTFTARMLNGEEELGAVPVEIVDGLGGYITANLDEAMIAKLSRYTTLRLFDSEYDTVIAERRIVMQR